MVFFTSLCTHYERFVRAETFLRFPRCAPKSKCGPVIRFGQRTDRTATLSTFKHYSRSTGTPLSANSWYPVSLGPSGLSISNEKPEAVAIGKYHGRLELQFSTNTAVRLFAPPVRANQLMMFAQAESLRSTLHKLEDLLKEYSPLMSGLTEGVTDKCIKYGTVFADVSSPIGGQQDIDTL
jgi:hypothetical protein